MSGADGSELGMESSDEQFMIWMRGNLERAAAEFGVARAGDPVFGWRLRSISCPVTRIPAAAGVSLGDQAGSGSDDQQCWLRVVSEYPKWARGNAWTGNLDSNVISWVTKPRVLSVTEWDDGDRRQRGELMTRLDGQVVASSDVLRQEVNLDQQWWRQLRSGLQALAGTPTRRVHASAQSMARQARSTMGIELRVRSWETVHGDLHWANLLAPELGVLDWELWGRGPVFFDAAYLYCHSLAVPEVAARVFRLFGDVLDTDDGRIAQLVAISRMLRRVAGGDYPDLEGVLRDRAGSLLAAGS